MNPDCYQDIFNSLCRICLRPNSCKMVSLLDRSDNIDGLSCYGKAVMSFTNITIKSNERLPSQMCVPCLYLLKSAIKFKLKCEASNKQVEKFMLKIDESKEHLSETFVQYLLFVHHFPNEFVCNVNDKNGLQRHEKGLDGNESKIIDEFVNESGCNDEFKNDNIDKTDEPDTVKMYDNDECDDDGNGDDNTATDDDLHGETQTIFDDDADGILNFMEKLNETSYDFGGNPKIKGIDDRCKSPKKKSSRVKWKKVRQLRQKAPIRAKKSDKRRCDKENPLDNHKHSCKTCGKVLANKQSLHHHQQRHDGFKFICEVCGKGYASKAELEFHQAGLHGVGKLLQCQYCSFKTPRKYDLTEHERIHTGERPFACDTCGRTFRRKHLYNKHIVHHTEKRIQCPQCPRRFHHRSHMLEHANNVHARRYVYSCVRCGCLYARAATLRRHLSGKHDVPRDRHVLHKVYASAKLTAGGVHRRAAVEA